MSPKKLEPKRAKKEVIEDVLCCCDLSHVDSAVECVINYNVISDVCAMWFRQYNFDTGFVPLSTGFSPGYLECYLIDAIAHYLYINGAFGDTAPYDMGAFPLPYTLACLIREVFCAKTKDGATFVPRPTGFGNSSINARTYVPAGSFLCSVIDDLAPLVSGEPVFTNGPALSAPAIRAYYPDFAARIVSYGACQISQIPYKGKHFDFFHNGTSIETCIPGTGRISVATPTNEEFGIAPEVVMSSAGYPGGGVQMTIGAYIWIMSHFNDPKMTYRKALTSLGYDPLTFTVHAELINLSKFRGLITTFAQYRGASSWTPADQSEFITALVAFTSQIYCRTPSHLSLWGSNNPGWVSTVWRDMPTIAAIAELGTLPRRVDNVLWFPYFQNNSVTYPNGTSLMALIRTGVPIVASYNEDFDEFPFDFTFTGPLLICNQAVPATTDRINYIPLYVYSETMTVLSGFVQEVLVPMPKMKPIVPAIIPFVKSKNVTLLGTMGLVLPGPTAYSCFAVCTRKECSLLPGLGLFTRRSIGKYSGFAADISGEYWIRLVRASVVVSANIVTAGHGSSSPQKNLANLFYNQLIGDATGRPGYMPSRNLLRAADLWRSEGNAVPAVTESSLLQILSNPAFANTVAAAVAGGMYTFNGVRGLINGRAGYNILW